MFTHSRSGTAFFFLNFSKTTKKTVIPTKKQQFVAATSLCLSVRPQPHQSEKATDGGFVHDHARRG
jgi:hypothetical protein